MDLSMSILEEHHQSLAGSWEASTIPAAGRDRLREPSLRSISYVMRQIDPKLTGGIRICDITVFVSHELSGQAENIEVDLHSPITFPCP
jgi:hypothetical protein